MIASAILAELKAHGITLRADGDSIRAHPASCLTDEHRRLIRAHKPVLLTALAAANNPDLVTQETQLRTVAKPAPDPAGGVFRYRVAHRPGVWLPMIAHGCDLAEAVRLLNLHWA